MTDPTRIRGRGPGRGPRPPTAGLRAGRSAVTSRQHAVWPDAFIARLRSVVPLAEVMSRRGVALKRAGSMMVGLCPFHEERTPSFKVNLELNTFHCFGCKAHGDAIDFLMRFEGLDFRSAVRDLAHQASIPVPEEAPSQHDAIYRCCEAAAAWFVSCLPDTTRAYLADRRGLGAAIVQEMRIGYAPPAGLLEHLRAEGFDDAVLVESGLAYRQSPDKPLRALLRDRVIFPVTDLQGRVVAFGGRLVEGAEGPKYVNTPNTRIYEKSALSFGLREAAAACRRQTDGARRVLVVEGYFDVAALRAAGIKHVVAACGTSVSAAMARGLFRVADEIVILFDPDGAGREESRKAFLSGLSVLPERKGVRVADVPGDLDPDQFVRRFGAEALLQVVDGAPDVQSTLLEIAGHDPAASPEAQAHAVDRLADLLAVMPPSAYREILAASLARRVDLSPGTLLDMVHRHANPVQPSSSRSARTAGSGDDDSVLPSTPLAVLVQVGVARPDVLAAAVCAPPWGDLLDRAAVQAALLAGVRGVRILEALRGIFTAARAKDPDAELPSGAALIDRLVDQGACTGDESARLYARLVQPLPPDPAHAVVRALEDLARAALKPLQVEDMDQLAAGHALSPDRIDRVNIDLDQASGEVLRTLLAGL